jgi:hypothetical protein
VFRRNGTAQRGEGIQIDKLALVVFHDYDEVILSCNVKESLNADNGERCGVFGKNVGDGIIPTRLASLGLLFNVGHVTSRLFFII